MTIINDDSMVVNKLEASLTDDTRVIIYDCHMFIVQATGHRDSSIHMMPSDFLDVNLEDKIVNYIIWKVYKI
jgi:hypothetical protein